MARQKKPWELVPRKNSPYLYARWRIKGRRTYVYRSTGIKLGRVNVADAERRAKEIYEESQQRHTTMAVTAEGVSEVTIEHMESLDQLRYLRRKGVLGSGDMPIYNNKYDKAMSRWSNDCSANWSAIKRFTNTLAASDIRDYCVKTVKAFIGDCLNRGLAPQSIKSYLLLFKRGLDLASDEFNFPNPITPIRWKRLSDMKNAPRKECNSGKYRTHEVIDKFLDVLGRDTEVARQIIVARETAIRGDGEMGRLRPKDCEGGTLRIVGKTEARERFAVLTPSSQAAITEQLASRTPEQVSKGMLWSGKNYRKRMEAASKKLGLEYNLTFRDMRATWAVNKYIRGTPESSRMRTMGHDNVSTHRLYLHSISEFKRLDALRRHSEESEA